MVVLADKEIREGRTPFSEGDARLLLSMASMVATAVATARRVQAIERDRQRLADENRALRDVARREGFIGESPQIEEMLELVRRAAPTGVNVLLRGESGVGKERVARLLHSFSDRAREPFVPLNCAALPETLLESELFGIEEGVATGVQRRHGKIELANGGTLFLDEVADLSLALQAKLLRVVSRRWSSRANSDATCTTGSGLWWSRCRRCAIVAPTFRSWRDTSSNSTANASDAPASPSLAKRSRP
jgi:transcriptional regulator with GAF, ATPase, and Fis domain